MELNWHFSKIVLCLILCEYFLSFSWNTLKYITAVATATKECRKRNVHVSILFQITRAVQIYELTSMIENTIISSVCWSTWVVLLACDILTAWAAKDIQYESWNFFSACESELSSLYFSKHDNGLCVADISDI